MQLFICNKKLKNPPYIKLCSSNKYNHLSKNTLSHNNTYKPNPSSIPMNRLIIDTETTGLSPHYNKTLTVGLLLVNPKLPKLKILASDHIFVKHDQYNSNPRATKIHKIDIKQHDLHAVPPQKACNQINSFLEKNQARQIPIVGHNIGFDKGFLRALFQQGEADYPFSEESIDTMRIWRDLQKQDIIPSHLRATLGHLATHFEIDYTKAHDALADCHITAKVYHELLKLQ